jgi:hypothetical protein
MINSLIPFLNSNTENMCSIDDSINHANNIDPNYSLYFYMLEYTFFTLFGFYLGNTLTKLVVSGYTRCCRKQLLDADKGIEETGQEVERKEDDEDDEDSEDNEGQVISELYEPILDIVNTKLNDLEVKICNHNLKIYETNDSITAIINNILKTLLNTKQLNECKDKDAREEQVHQVYSGILTLFSLNPASDRNVVHIELINKSLFTVAENRRWLNKKLDQDFCSLYLKQIMFYGILVYGGSIHVKHSRIQHTITSWDGAIQCNITCNSGTVTISDLMSIQEKKHKIVWNHTLVPSVAV